MQSTRSLVEIHNTRIWYQIICLYVCLFWQEIITLTRPIRRKVWNLPHNFHLYLIIDECCIFWQASVCSAPIHKSKSSKTDVKSLKILENRVWSTRLQVEIYNRWDIVKSKIIYLYVKMTILVLSTYSLPLSYLTSTSPSQSISNLILAASISQHYDINQVTRVMQSLHSWP